MGVVAGALKWYRCCSRPSLSSPCVLSSSLGVEWCRRGREDTLSARWRGLAGGGWGISEVKGRGMGVVEEDRVYWFWRSVVESVIS